MLKTIRKILNPFQIINAKEKINNLYFSNYDDYEEYNYGTFTCSNCNENLTFDRKDLIKHMMRNITNLSSIDAKKINTLLNLTNKKDVNSFIDFYCPKCKLPIRIYYLAGVGGKHAEEAFEIKYVVEKKDKCKQTK